MAPPRHDLSIEVADHHDRDAGTAQRLAQRLENVAALVRADRAEDHGHMARSMLAELRTRARLGAGPGHRGRAIGNDMDLEPLDVAARQIRDVVGGRDCDSTTSAASPTCQARCVRALDRARSCRWRLTPPPRSEVTCTTAEEPIAASYSGTALNTSAVPFQPGLRCSATTVV